MDEGIATPASVLWIYTLRNVFGTLTLLDKVQHFLVWEQKTERYILKTGIWCHILNKYTGGIPRSGSNNPLLVTTKRKWAGIRSSAKLNKSCCKRNIVPKQSTTTRTYSDAGWEVAITKIHGKYARSGATTAPFRLTESAESVQYCRMCLSKSKKCHNVPLLLLKCEAKS